MEIQDWISGELNISLWENKYQNEGESFEQWLNRVSGGNVHIKDRIRQQQFLFGGRILANRGLANGRGLTYSNCYVIEPPEDSIEGIYDTAKKLARTFSYGGGCGIDISNLRPKGAEVHNAAKTTSGAVSFMSTFEQVSNVIGQKGRRGALMISMDCNHADISDFIDAKLDNKLEKCNISVRVDDSFMNQACSEGTTENQLMKQLSKNNWNWGEPGLLYWDNITQYNLLDKHDNFKYAGVNPCAEEPLPAGGSCLLGAINLSAFVEEGLPGQTVFNIPDFRGCVRDAIIALNEVLDEGLELHPLQEQRESVHDWRQIGLGIMGFADMLLKLNCQYDSQRAVDLINQIGTALVDEGIKTSAILAKQYGSFPQCDLEALLNSNFITNNKECLSHETVELLKEYGLRNSQLFTIAPTGSISTMLGISGGVEPIFATSYTRKTQALHGEDTFYTVYTPIIQHMLDNEIITENTIDTIKTAQNINPKDRVAIQGLWQKYIDASISSTVNLVNETTEEEIFELYIEGWLRGCKGLTVYRAGCSKEGVLVAKPKEDEKKEVKEPVEVPIGLNETIELKRGQWAPIPDDTLYMKRKVYTGCGKLNLFIGYSYSQDKVVEIFVKRSGQGGCEHNIDSTVICMSGMLRLGGTLGTVKKAFSGCGSCNSFTRAKCRGQQLSPGKSCSTAILNMVETALTDVRQGRIQEENTISLNEVTDVTQVEQGKGITCPDCGTVLHMSGGCVECPNCGYSKCE